MGTVGISMPPELEIRLKDLAKEKGKKVSTLVQELVTETLDAWDKERNADHSPNDGPGSPVEGLQVGSSGGLP